MAAQRDEWAANDIKLLGLTGSTVPELMDWHAEIEDFFDVTGYRFPRRMIRACNCHGFSA